MRTIILALVALIGLPAVARAQASVSFQLNLPVVLPALVVVSPGVQVVPDVDEEVFFVDGYYWVRRDAGWYRSRTHRSGWALVPARGVPARIGSLPPGKYKRWKPAAHRDDHGRGHGDGGDHGRGDGYGKKHGKHGKH
jgi:hypothetical protein